ncbi:MAG: Uma2 family endonuclease [Tepidisphaeraceae bacterium]
MTQIQAEHTFDDLLNLPEDGKLYELVRGQLVEKEMGFLAVWIATQIAALIKQHVDPQRRGWVATEALVGCFEQIRNHGRRPDVIYFHRERLPTPMPTEDPVTVVPNWVVEIISKNDNALEVDEKVQEYLDAGVELVWVVNPQLKTVRVHADLNRIQVFHEPDTITGEPVLPDFSATVRDFFPTPAMSATK